jgi:hypothetical protein
MSTLWTPSGEHPVERSAPGRPSVPGAPGSGADRPKGPPPSPDEAAADVEELARQLSKAPAEVVVSNHCYGLFELAAVYLSQSPPLLPQARLAIDALGAVVEGLGDRLGESAPALRDALAQVRLAFVQIQAAGPTPSPGANGGPTVSGEDPGPAGDDPISPAD